MSKSRYFNVLVLLLGVLFISSCSKFRKIQKSTDWQVKYDAAYEYYKDKDYYKSIALYDEVLPIIRGKKVAEDANFYYAYAHFHDKQYILAAHHFKTFYTIYSRSDHAMEAEYMYAYSLYMQSPISSLDQSSTYESIAAMQTFLNKYPYSEYSKNANEIIDKLQVKLETKAVDNARQYYKLRRYKSALVAFKNFKVDYPDSEYQEEICFLEIDAQFQLAKQSIVSKQKERYQNTVDLYLKFIDKFESSSYLKDAESRYEDSTEALRKFKTNN
ncbi:MAG: outer membrane protein assembly factor BamD [bacterium]|nr:outer membrane protein assembly factor BamD [bacterium]